MSDIEWKEDAVCYGDGRQWFVNTGCDSEKFELVNNDGMRKYSMYGVLNYPKDFQLNEIRIGDFIPASELDAEQKYNKVVEALGLFGFPRYEDCQFHEETSTYIFADGDGDFTGTNELTDCTGRQVTYNQIIAIGKLKRMMLERERSKGVYVDEITIPDNTSEFDAIVSSKSVGMSEPKKSVNVVMTNKTAAIKVLEALGMDSSFVQSVSINGKEVFSIENADDITTVTVSKYVKKT